MEDSAMNISTPAFHPTPAPVAELERLGDEIAELAAHVERIVRGCGPAGRGPGDHVPPPEPSTARVSRRRRHGRRARAAGAGGRRGARAGAHGAREALYQRAQPASSVTGPINKNVS